MTDFLILLLSMSVSGSILMLLLLGLRPVLGRKLSGAWMYYIWIIVALRMLLPFTPEQGLLNRTPGSLGVLLQESSVPGSAGSQDALMSGNSGLTENMIGNSGLPDTSSGKRYDIQKQEESMNADIPEEVWLINGMLSFLSVHLPDAVPAILFFLWLTAAIFLFLRAAVASRAFLKRIRCCSFPVDSPEINACYEKACGRLSIHRPPQLLGSTEGISPMLTGLLKPAIVLPVSVLQHPEKLSFIFRHELTHYKRKDIWFKWLFQLVECVHFFNPLAYLLRRQVERCCELSCDEAVVKDMTFQERKAYGATLLDVLESGSFSCSPSASASLCENAAFMKERLVMIKKMKKKNRFIKVITPLLTTGICFGAFYLGACAAPAAPSQTGNAVPASIPRQPQASGVDTFTELSAAVPPSSSKNAASYADAEVPAGFTLLKTETVSLDSIQELQLLLSYEDVTLYPSPDNTVTMLFFGNNRFTYAKDEIASLVQTSGIVSLESGKMNKAWSKLSPNKWQPKVYVYLPAVFAGNLHVQIGSGSLQSATNLQAASASFETSSGKMVLGDVSAEGHLSLTNHSGSTSAGILSGEQCVLDNSSGRLTTGIITSLKSGALTNASGSLTVGNITAGQCSIENLSGNLNLNLLDISGSLKLTTISGPVSAGQIAAKIYTVSTGSGKMEIQSLAGNGSLTSGSGSIRTGSLALTGALTMETGSGSIHAAIPESTGIDLTIASVGSGSIHTSFSISDYKKADSGTSVRYGNAPYHPVTVSAGSGSIKLK